ncbi:MAG: glycosyltransferase family 2 protein [Pseudomonadota bacterium]
MSATVSILMPCYNAEAYLPAALDSALGQTYTSTEIIVVNDGSTDRSVEILNAYVDKGVKVIHQENAGQCAAANRAYQACSGQMIKFFDADDIMSPEMIALQVAALGDDTTSIAMGEWARFRDDPATAQFNPLPMYRTTDPVDWLRTEWMDAQPMMQCALWLIPRAILEKTSTWDERLSLINDFECFARVLLGANELKYTPGARLYYRSVPGSLSAQRSRKAVESAFLSLTLGTDHLLAVDDNAETRRACANVLQNFNYEYFPKHADLRKQISDRVRALGGSDLVPTGPPRFHQVRKLFGWRTARRIQHLFERAQATS